MTRRQTETALRLTRLGVRWRLNPMETLVMRNAPLSETAHPWRDPFTGKAFQTSQTASQTLIYSMGPDLIDQCGAIYYARHQGIGNAGDIVIRLPKQIWN